MPRSTSSPIAQPLLMDISDAKLHVTPEHFDLLCLNNPDLRLELTKDGELIVMAPTGGESGKKNLDLTTQVGVWNKKHRLGEAFDSSTGYDFTALGGGKMSPDVSWIEKSRLVGMDITRFIPVVPDFVIELRSSTDHLSTLQTKMQEYQRLGVKLGLLINPQDRQVEIYWRDQATERLESPLIINCSEVMIGFTLDLSEIWER
jgi:Uma2 family endonuclease